MEIRSQCESYYSHAGDSWAGGFTEKMRPSQDWTAQAQGRALESADMR